MYVSHAYKLFNIMKPWISQTKRGNFVLISPPSLKFFCVYVTWLTKYGKVIAERVHSSWRLVTSHFTCIMVTNTMVYVHDVFNFSPDLRKSPAITAGIEGKTHCSLIFKKYSNTTRVYWQICCWLVAGRSEMYVGTFYLVEIDAVFMKSQIFDGQKLVKKPITPPTCGNHQMAIL